MICALQVLGRGAEKQVWKGRDKKGEQLRKSWYEETPFYCQAAFPLQFLCIAARAEFNFRKWAEKFVRLRVKKNDGETFNLTTSAEIWALAKDSFIVSASLWAKAMLPRLPSWCMKQSYCDCGVVQAAHGN